MSKKNSMKTTITTALGTAAIAAMVTLPLAKVDTNPFSATDLGSGYQVLDQAKQVSEGKCGEGKCGEKKPEGKCGSGKCGSDK